MATLEFMEIISYNWKMEDLILSAIYMGMPKNVRESMSAEAVEEVEIFQELERLFRELESGETNEDRREELAHEIRQTLERHHQLFHDRVHAKGFVEECSKRIKKALEKSAA